MNDNMKAIKRWIKKRNEADARGQVSLRDRDMEKYEQAIADRNRANGMILIYAEWLIADEEEKEENAVIEAFDLDDDTDDLDEPDDDDDEPDDTDEPDDDDDEPAPEKPALKKPVLAVRTRWSDS